MVGYRSRVEWIDCSACVPVCPASAISALDDLPEKWKPTRISIQAGKFAAQEFAKYPGE